MVIKNRLFSNGGVGGTTGIGRNGTVRCVIKKSRNQLDPNLRPDQNFESVALSLVTVLASVRIVLLLRGRSVVIGGVGVVVGVVVVGVRLLVTAGLRSGHPGLLTLGLGWVNRSTVTAVTTNA